MDETINIPLYGGLSARLYKDSSPHCMETSQLQKGLILTLNGKELIEEGLGFGAPVIRYKDKTYFSSSAEISTERDSSTQKLSKTFRLDTVSRKKFWRASYINDNVYSSVRKTFATLYLSRKNMSPLFNALMDLREIAKIKTEFTKVKARGTVTVNYEIHPKVIDVAVDFSDLMLEGCVEILVLNEQGSINFETYVDTDCLKLSGREIGAWDLVTADSGSLVNSQADLSFSLGKIGGVRLFRGWERTRNRFSWAGLSYSLNPTNQVFNYEINLSY